MIHRPTRLVDIIELGRKYRLEPKVIQFVHPRVGKAPNLMLVEFSKDGRPELKILDPLYVYGDDGNYTEEIRKILKKISNKNFSNKSVGYLLGTDIYNNKLYEKINNYVNWLTKLA